MSNGFIMIFSPFRIRLILTLYSLVACLVFWVKSNLEHEKSLNR